MPLDYTPVDIPLARGIDNRSDSKVMEPTSLADLKNAVFDKRGALVKREGLTALTADVISSATNISAGHGVYSLGDSLLMADGNSLYQYSTTEGSWKNHGTYIGWQTEEAYAVPNTGGYASALVPCNLAEANSIRVTAYYKAYPSADAGVYYQIEDTSDGTLLLEPTQLLATSTGTPVFVVNPAGSNNILVIYRKASNTTLQVFKVDTTDVETSIAGSAVESASTDFTQYFDVALSGSQLVYAAATTGAAPQNLRVGFIAAAGTFGSTASLRSGAVKNSSQVAVFTNSDGTSHVALFKDNATTKLSYSMFDGSLTESATNLVEDTAVSDAYKVTGIWAADDSEWTALWANAYTVRTAVHNSSGTQTTAPATKLFATQLLGKLFRVNSAVFYLVTPVQRLAIANGVDSNTNLSLLCMALSDHKPVGAQLRAQAAYQMQWGLIAPQSYSSSNTVWVQYAAPTNDGQIKRVKYDLSTADATFAYGAYNGVQFGNALYLSGPMTWEFDGSELRENGFLVFPSMQDTGGYSFLTASNGAGSLTVSSTYKYRIYYEYYDYRGRRAQSAFPFELSVDLGATDDTVDIVVPTLQWTRRDAGAVNIAVYRTLANGTTFYRVDEAPNVTSAVSITIVDTLADSSLADNELDYQSAGELDNLPFPAVTAFAASQERLFGVEASDPRKVVYSKLPDGDGALEWNDGLYLEFPENIAAISTVGGVLQAFSPNTCYSVAGDGPDNTGSSGAFSPPLQTATNLGAANARAVGQTPLGTVFASARGVWLLDVQGTPKFIGDGLSHWSGELSDQVFTSILPVPGTSRIRLIAHQSSSNRVLDWDYEFNIWTTHTFPATAYIGATSIGNRYYCVLSSTGVVNYQDSRVDNGSSAAFTDNGTGIAIVAKVGWIRPTGSTHANSRATHGYLLGEDLGHGHSVTVEVAYDYDETFTTVGTFAATDFPHIRFRLPRLSFRAIMFKITEVPDGSPGEGIELSALGLELATEGTTGGRLLDS